MIVMVIIVQLVKYAYDASAGIFMKKFSPQTEYLDISTLRTFNKVL